MGTARGLWATEARFILCRLAYFHVYIFHVCTKNRSFLEWRHKYALYLSSTISGLHSHFFHFARHVHEKKIYWNKNWIFMIGYRFSAISPPSLPSMNQSVLLQAPLFSFLEMFDAVLLPFWIRQIYQPLVADSSYQSSCCYSQYPSKYGLILEKA